MSAIDHLPVIIGAGQATHAVPEDLAAAESPADLAGAALKSAFDDASIKPQALDHAFAVRLFGDSGPAFPNPFGRSENFPASVCARLGISAKTYTYDFVGGQSPQSLVADAARLLMDGSSGLIAIFGAEAIANIKAAGRAGVVPAWSEDPGAPLDDRGLYPPGPFIVSEQAMTHRISAPMFYYGLMECARRASMGLSKADYRAQMAAIWGRFATVAKANPYAWERSGLSGDQITKPHAKNPLVTTPYTKAMVARDGVNQGAAILMTTRGRALAMGLSEDQLTYLHAHSEAGEPAPLFRDRIDRSEAQEQVLRRVGMGADIHDLYSCFPIVPLESARILGLADDAVMTLTGGLPFFGGPGNNYSLHGIAEAHARVRGSDTIAVVHANGGMMSKHAAGRYSGVPKEIVALHKEEGGQAARAATTTPDPSGALIAYSVLHRRGEPSGVLMVGETESGARFYAKADADAADDFLTGDPIGAAITTQTAAGANALTGLR